MGKKAKKGKSIEEKKAEVSALLETLEQGVTKLATSKGWREWLKFQASVYKYSWSNTLLILRQCPEASVVMGFRAWKEHGRAVQKGQKGLKILFPCFKKKEEANDATDAGERAVAYFRVGSVFDVSQTEGAEIPRPCYVLTAEEDRGMYAALKRFSESRGVPVTKADLGPAGGSFSPTENAIRVANSRSLAHQAKTLAHEVAHSMLHTAPLKDKQAKATAELEAESVAFIVAEHFGVKAGRHSFGYIRSWKGPEAVQQLKLSAKRIADCARTILEALDSDGAASESEAA